MTGRVDGLVAIVTGGGSGIGAATASLLVEEGARVVVADLLAARASAVADSIGDRGLAVTADVSVEADVVAMIDAALTSFGRIDILHNNAALVDPVDHARDRGVISMDADLWDRVMAVNVRGPMLACKHAIPHMRRSGGGAIVNMSSGSARLGDLTRTAYGASKAAIEALTKYVATQHGPEGIRANAIAPGLVLTPAAADNLPAAHRDVLADQILVPHFADPGDIARLVVYLSSDESRYVTGQAIAIDGGMSAHQPTYAEYRKLL